MAEWFGEGQRGAPSTPDMTAAVQTAVKSGERAIDEQVVPSRFDPLLRRYFSRLQERVKSGSSGAQSPTQPAPTGVEPAKDAP